MSDKTVTGPKVYAVTFTTTATATYYVAADNEEAARVEFERTPPKFPDEGVSREYLLSYGEWEPMEDDEFGVMEVDRRPTAVRVHKGHREP